MTENIIVSGAKFAEELLDELLDNTYFKNCGARPVEIGRLHVVAGWKKVARWKEEESAYLISAKALELSATRSIFLEGWSGKQTFRSCGAGPIQS